MQTLLYIDLKEKSESSYEKKIISLLTSKYPALVSLDIDYTTDSTLMNHAQRLIDDSSACILYIESDEKYAHKIVPFAETYIRNPEKFIVFLEGENSWLKKLAKGLTASNIHNNLVIEEVIKLASGFLKSNFIQN